MRALLDTCTLIWLAQEPGKLSARCVEVIDDPANDLVVSHVSVWELALKAAAGKFRFPIPLRSWLEQQRSHWRFEYLAIGLEHILRTNEIERHHADPFDRLIVSQAMVENLGILTPDQAVASYPVHVIW